MKNVLHYYYNLIIDELHQNKKTYIFFYQQYEYYFIPYHRSLEDAPSIYLLNIELLKQNNYFHRIILNKDRQILTWVDQIPYILLQIHLSDNRTLTLNDLQLTYPLFIPKKKEFQNLVRFDWINLWQQKIDYFEYQIDHFQKKYPILLSTISYFIGLGENAISYIQNTFLEFKNNINTTLMVSHRRTSPKDTLFDFYNPLNLILDHKVRDVAEYLKSLFYSDCYNIEEIEIYLSKSHFTEFDYRLLFGRLLFPSFYFDYYDEIINGYRDEKTILEITNRIYEYERYLYDLYFIFKKNVNLPPVEWLVKQFFI